MQVLDRHWTLRRPHDEPYPWLATEPGELYSLERAQLLAETFPLNGFVRLDASENGRSKTYRNYSRTIVNDAVSELDELPAPWRALVAELTGAEYRREVARLLRQPVARAMELRLVRHGQGDWLGPHTDRPDKAFSHILYFNAGWQPDWGGCLEILTGNSPTAVSARVLPQLGASALLARTDSSWHQVSAVAADPVPERMSLLVHGLW